jgi:hypothetical protein
MPSPEHHEHAEIGDNETPRGGTREQTHVFALVAVSMCRENCRSRDRQFLEPRSDAALQTRWLLVPADWYRKSSSRQGYVEDWLTNKEFRNGLVYALPSV